MCALAKNAVVLLVCALHVAPVLADSELTSFSDATSYLYTGTAPVQTGVAPGTIAARRAAVARVVVRTIAARRWAACASAFWTIPNTAVH